LGHDAGRRGSARFGRYNRTDPWQNENITLSGHLILVCLFEAVMSHARFRAGAAWLPEREFCEIAKNILPVAVGPWRWAGMKFFAGNGAFMCAAEYGEFDGEKGYSVRIGAKTEYPLQFLEPFLDDNWDYCVMG
jgi:hypothetical protein